MYVQAIEPQSSGRAANAFSCWAIFPFDHGNFYKGMHLIWVIYSVSEVQSVITMVGCDSVQADMVLVAESPTSCGQQEVNWDTGQYPEHRKPKAHPQSDTLPLTRAYPFQQIHTSLECHFLWDYGGQIRSNYHNNAQDKGLGERLGVGRAWSYR